VHAALPQHDFFALHASLPQHDFVEHCPQQLDAVFVAHELNANADIASMGKTMIFDRFCIVDFIFLFIVIGNSQIKLAQKKPYANKISIS